MKGLGDLDVQYPINQQQQTPLDKGHGGHAIRIGLQTCCSKEGCTRAVMGLLLGSAEAAEDLG